MEDDSLCKCPAYMKGPLPQMRNVLFLVYSQSVRYTLWLAGTWGTARWAPLGARLVAPASHNLPSGCQLHVEDVAASLAIVRGPSHKAQPLQAAL